MLYFFIYFQGNVLGKRAILKLLSQKFQSWLDNKRKHNSSAFLRKVFYSPWTSAALLSPPL